MEALSSHIHSIRKVSIGSLQKALERLTTHPAPAGEISSSYFSEALGCSADDARGLLELWRIFAFVDYSDNPIKRWVTFSSLSPADQQRLLRALLEVIFKAPDGTTVATAAEEHPDREDMILWFASHHDLTRSAAEHADQIYRTVQAFVDNPVETKSTA
ncbi:hypothetical protein ACQPXH_24020 [Nocardia sp. CA-135953]|uniref:hypothetical protein n=1 Tax=Nocardia sp. CA-135953 TaxID=3239978 RepID=UPI003D990CA5